MELSAQAREYVEAVRAVADGVVVGVDFDGTLSPIVADPEQARIHPDAGDVLVALAQRVRAVAVITGRPARQALALGDLDVVGEQVAAAGRELFVLGQYGNERWSSSRRQVLSPTPPRGLATLMAELPRLLADAEASEAWVEEKGLAVAVHTRRLADPRASYERVLAVLTDAARAKGLEVEPGRFVVEVRAPGMDKGAAVRRLTEELDARGWVFCGDDRGDLAAFRAVLELRDQGLPTLLVCASRGEVPELEALADVVVDGPAEVLALLREALLPA